MLCLYYSAIASGQNLAWRNDRGVIFLSGCLSLASPMTWSLTMNLGFPIYWTLFGSTWTSLLVRNHTPFSFLFYHLCCSHFYHAHYVAITICYRCEFFYTSQGPNHPPRGQNNQNATKNQPSEWPDLSPFGSQCHPRTHVSMFSIMYQCYPTYLRGFTDRGWKTIPV